MSHIGSRTLKKDNKVKLADDSGDSDYDHDDIYMMKKDEGLYPVRGQPGMFYKVWLLGAPHPQIGSPIESLMVILY